MSDEWKQNICGSSVRNGVLGATCLTVVSGVKDLGGSQKVVGHSTGAQVVVTMVSELSP